MFTELTLKYLSGPFCSVLIFMVVKFLFVLPSFCVCYVVWCLVVY